MANYRSRFQDILLICLLVAALFTSVGTIAVSADSHVTLSFDDSTAIPSENVEFEGENYAIDAIAVRTNGDAFTARVKLPDAVFTSVAFLLYNSDQQIQDSKQINRPGTEETATFETDSYTPGTYMLNVELEGSTERMQPVVIAGYDVVVKHPDTATREDDFEVTADVTPTTLSTSPAGVEVVVWNDSHAQTFEMSQSSDETYTASIPLDEFATGEYRVNVAALGDETFRGQQEVLALEDSSLTIQETTSDDDKDGSDSGGNNGQNSDDSTTDESDDEDGSTSDDDGSVGTDNSTDDGDGSGETDNTTDTEDTSSDTDTTTDDDDTGDSATNGSGESDTTASADSDDDVISPNQNTSSEGTDDRVSLFAVQGLLLLLIIVFGVRRVRD